MPEGPSIVILKELVSGFKGKKIVEASGNTKALDPLLLKGSKVADFRSWGKHFLIVLPDRVLRIHFMLFGSYSINEKSKPNPRLQLGFNNGSIYFYSCSIKVIEGDIDEVYDWTADVMNDRWDPAKARKKLKAMPDTLVCDALLDQQIFAGVGNIIKNEVLYRIGVHPGSRVGALPPRKLGAMIKEARNYSFDFLKWKKAFELKKHWMVYAKKVCPDGEPVVRVRQMGRTKRRTFFCEGRQVLYE
ncbi:MAG TPA: DNA-formamidopyrimidine glycosylase family protein [Puia sp.]|jgi:endonuclease-8